MFSVGIAFSNVCFSLECTCVSPWEGEVNVIMHLENGRVTRFNSCGCVESIWDCATSLALISTITFSCS